MVINIQPTLSNPNITLSPLNDRDFEDLYLAASNPKIWEQHTNKDRFKKEVFEVYFKGAIQSAGAFKIVDNKTNEIIGSTRFYDYNEADNSMLIGYTFIATNYWGKGINAAVKVMMLNYIFQYVSKVFFHIGSNNIRSQIAINRLSALKISEIEVAYFGEESKLNFVYEINRENWRSKLN